METNPPTGSSVDGGAVLDWLLQGDPAIRWQVKRDLLDAPEDDWQAERRLVASQGWGKAFLDLQDPQGTWGGGLYSPKWISTTYTLLTLIDCGLPEDTEEAQKGAQLILDWILAGRQAKGGKVSLASNDTCIHGFYIGITSYFGFDHAPLHELGEALLDDQMEDGGWNCRRHRDRKCHHGSFHTTFNVLEGLRIAVRKGIVDGAKFQDAEARAMEFMLQHHLYRSDKTGQIIDKHFTEISFPPRWHYDILRGLDYIRLTAYARDERLGDALELLRSRQREGIWPAQNRHAGKVFFHLEPGGRRSRWNTLRALRVLRGCAGPA